jgi:DNA-binding PadR family transcriptional regulator
MTLQVRLVLHMLADDPGRERYGLEIVDSTGLMPGTIYPILARLEAAGWIDSRWEDVDHHAAGRPRRRYYRLTAEGLANVARSLVDSPRRAAGRGAVGPILPGGAR